MNSTAPAFKPINFDTVKKAVKEVAAEKNIPRLTYPAETPPASAATETADTAPAAKRAARKGGTPAKTVRIAVSLPDYLVKAIAKNSADKDVTKRFLYLSALRAAGYVIHDIDMQEDGRRESAA